MNESCAFMASGEHPYLPFHGGFQVEIAIHFLPLSDHIGTRYEIKPFDRIRRQLLQFGRKATEGKENGTRLVQPASLWQTRYLCL